MLHKKYIGLLFGLRFMGEALDKALTCLFLRMHGARARLTSELPWPMNAATNSDTGIVV